MWLVMGMGGEKLVLQATKTHRSRDNSISNTIGDRVTKLIGKP